jgi:hypothetical protein
MHPGTLDSVASHPSPGQGLGPKAADAFSADISKARVQVHRLSEP